MSEELAGSRWIRRTSIEGGWVVVCRLCGHRSSRKTFMAKMTNHAEAERASREYAHEHIASPGHQAALRAHQTVKPEAFEGARFVAEFLGEHLSEADLRKRIARCAAAKVERQAANKRQQDYFDSLPKCAYCAMPVSAKADRSDERITLPSGALIHAKCAGA